MPPVLTGALVRHQLGGAAATVVDFGTMVLLVQGAGLSPVTATAISAPLGAVTNFVLSRRWIFPAHSGRVIGQAVRYAFVAAASAGWNTLGEHIVHGVLGANYVVGRAAVAIAVSMLWNYPMHRRFVFRERSTRDATGIP